jgi:hypothetical protein
VLSAQSLQVDKDLVPAFLAIRALRASLAVDVPANRIVMGRKGQVREDREAASLLMKVGQSRCTAAYQSDAVSLDCRELEPREREQHLRELELTKGWVGGAGREAITRSGRHLIMVTGGGPPLIVDVEDVDVAARMFYIDMDGFTIGGRYPTDEEASSGIGWVLQFSGRPSP